MSSIAPTASFAESARASQATTPLSTTCWLFAAHDVSGGDLRRAHVYLATQTATNAKAASRVLVTKTKRVPGATAFAIDARSAFVSVSA